jgi:hypothetical protein
MPSRTESRKHFARGVAPVRNLPRHTSGKSMDMMHGGIAMARISGSLCAIGLFAVIATGSLVLPASASPFAASASIAHARDSLAESMQHRVVSACYKKKVCVKWVVHTSHFGYSSHYCGEYAMKTVCDPDLLIGSKAPQSGSPRVDPPRLATPMHFRAQVPVRVR